MYLINKEDVLENQKLSNVLATKILNSNPVKVLKSFSIEKTIHLLHSLNCSGGSVIDHENKLMGFISESDLLLQVSHQDKTESIQFQEKPKSLTTEATLKEIVIYMTQNKLKICPITDQENTLVGQVSRMDLLLFIISFQKTS